MFIVAAFAVPPAADAATVTIKTWPTDCSGKVPDCAPVVWFTGGPGESNDLTVTATASGALPVVHLHDAGAAITVATRSSWCTAAGPNDVDCAPASAIAGDAVHVELGDADDRLTVVAPEPKTFRVVADGGAGADRLNAERSTASVYFGGGPGPDVITGGARSDALTGDGTFAQDPYPPQERAAAGNDVIDGGGGFDTVSYRGRTHGVAVDLAAGRGGEDGERDRITNIENVLGGTGPDRLVGDARPNWLDGGPGNDVVDGRGGRDSLSGEDGVNRLLGGAGDDMLYVGQGEKRVRTFTTAACGPGRDRVGGTDGHAEVRDDCEELGDVAKPQYRLFGPLRSLRSRVLQLNTRCDMTRREQQRHMVCRWRLALVTASGQIVGIKSVRTRRVPSDRTVRIPVRLNRLGRALLRKRGSLRVKLRMAAGLVRQHGGIPKPATTVFTTRIRLAL